jgi:hypothetical protein
MGLGRLTSNSIITWTYTNQTTSWLVPHWSTLVHGRATGKHEFTRIITARTWGSYHLPPYSIPYVWPWDQHPNVILSRDSQVGVPKFPKLKLMWLWGPITLCADLQLKWGLKQSCSPCWKLFNGMSHITCTQGNHGNSWLLMVKSQITNLTLGPSFGHNVC